MSIAPELQEELEQELQLCKDLRIVDPDFKPKHHGYKCGCPTKIYENGLFDGDAENACHTLEGRRTSFVAYSTDYPFFICARCRRLVPWCFGTADEYIDYCDDCAVELMRDRAGDLIDEAEYRLDDR